MDAVYKAIKELTSDESFKDVLARLDIRYKSSSRSNNPFKSVESLMSN
jgi:hypothetical protein